MENMRAPLRWLAFFCGLFLFWSLMFVICPAINRTFPAMQKIAAVVEEHNLRTGMFFYTDVDVTGDANLETAHTLRYMPRGGLSAVRQLHGPGIDPPVTGSDELQGHP